MEKIGLGIITCNRQSFFEQCITSAPQLDYLVVVNDGIPYPQTSIPSKVSDYIQHKKNMGIAKSKNDALKLMMENKCRHLFLIEDDIYFKDKSTINKYIEISKVSGLGHLNYGYHGPVNKDASGNPVYRKIVRYNSSAEIVFNYKLTGAFAYYRDDVVKNVGFMDEKYKNVLEHVDYTYRIIKAGYHPPFFWFADLANSTNYLSEADPELKWSLNKPYSVKYKLRVKLFNQYYKMKFGFFPSNTPDTSEEKFLKSIEEIRLKYGENINE